MNGYLQPAHGLETQFTTDKNEDKRYTCRHKIFYCLAIIDKTLCSNNIIIKG